MTYQVTMISRRTGMQTMTVSGDMLGSLWSDVSRLADVPGLVVLVQVSA